MGRVVQLTDTHVVREGSTYFGSDTSDYLARAIAAVNALDPLPDYIVVTGDLVNTGEREQYVRFRALMETAAVPYFVIPGNHDERDALRAALADATYGGSRERRIRFAIETYPIRLIGLDFNLARPWPGAKTDSETVAWLDRTLAAEPAKPTIVAVHQPPFPSGIRLADVGGFFGANALRRVIDAHPQLRALVCGHIHCSRSVQWTVALASSAPSTAPQIIPLLFARGKIASVLRESPGFVIHDIDDRGYRRCEVRIQPDGTYADA